MDDTSSIRECFLLFRLFVTAGVEIGDEVIHFRLLQDVGEGWHLTSTLEDLGADLSFVECAAYSGEIGTFGTARVADRVAVLAAVIHKQCCSALLRGLGGCREAGSGCEGQKES